MLAVALIFLVTIGLREWVLDWRAKRDFRRFTIALHSNACIDGLDDVACYLASNSRVVKIAKSTLVEGSEQDATAAVVILGEVVTDDQLLAEVVSNRTDMARYSASSILVSRGREGYIQTLVDGMKSEDGDVRAEISGMLWGLHELLPERTIQDLRPYLSDDEHNVRLYISWVLNAAAEKNAIE